MLLNFTTGFPILTDVVRGNKRHKDYERVCWLAAHYRQLITGEGAEQLLQQFVRREDVTMFAQRVLITSLLTEAWADTLMNPFYRIGRLDNVKKLIGFDSDVTNPDIRIQEIEDRLSSFYGAESLEKFLGVRFVELSFMDPNSFIAIEFEAFDNIKEKARPYPVEYTAEEAIHFNYKNNILQYLIIKKDIALDGTWGEQYLMYLPNEIIRLTQVKRPENQVIGENLNDQIVSGMWQCSPDRVFLVELYRPNAGEVQATRVGYKSDLRTNSRTYVNPFHATLAYFKKSIKIVSEADLTASLHAFPHVATWEEVCDGYPDLNISCKKGYDIKGNQCKRCKGKGVISHYSTSAQDAITLKMPKEGGPTPLVTPDNVISFKSPDIGILNWQDAKIEKLKSEAISTMYNNDVLSKTTVAETATAASAKREEMYNTLHPAAENTSSKWKFFTRVITVLLNNPKPKLLYEYPSDYKVQTVDELLDQLERANKSQGPASLRQAISLDIAAKVYVDDDYAFLKEKVKAKWIPMLGKSDDTVLMLISLGKLTDEEETLWIHSDSIFDDLENEKPEFFNYTYDKQWPLILEKINEIIDKLARKNKVLLTPFQQDEKD
jgi:hypothetical protein